MAFLRYRAARVLAFFAPFVLAAPLCAELHPNLERGFSPEKSFQMGEIDHVNLFNGNVTVTLPLGQSFPISDKISLRLTAVYNSKLWDSEKLKPPFESTATSRFIPDRLTNAGFGWTVTLGELIGSDDPLSATFPPGSYLSPDGGRHTFYRTLHPSEEETENVKYTRDGTYLRLRKSATDPDNWVLDFPDGVVQEFEPWYDGVRTRWRLINTRDPHGNGYSIVYTFDHASWTLTDTHGRRIVVTFGAAPVPPTLAYPSPNLSTVLKTIDLPGFGDSRARYEFTHEAKEIRRGNCGQDENRSDAFVAVPLLKTITLFHDTEQIASFTAGYDATLQSPNLGSIDEACKSGTLTSLKVPTQATIRWTYGTYWMPGNCKNELASDKSAGVRSRTYEAPDSGPFLNDKDAVWTYTPQLHHEPGNSFDCFGSIVQETPVSEMTNTVRAPSGDETIHYFWVWKIGRGEENLALYQDFGLPFSRKTSDTIEEQDTVYISTKTCRGPCSNGDFLRTTYVAYERDAAGIQFDSNRRMVRSKTVFHDDSNHWTATRSSNFDGVGHYRTVETLGDFGAGVTRRTTTTNYNVRDLRVNNSAEVLHTGVYDPANGGADFHPPPPTHEWILDTFSSVTATSGTSSTRQLLCFRPDTGDLRATRQLAGSSIAAKDLLAVFDTNAGFLEIESHYGGDDQPLLPTLRTQLCEFADATTEALRPRPLNYQTRHTYSHGVRVTSTPYKPDGTALPFKTLHLDVDPTGLARTVFDTAGIATQYTYDASGRPKTIKPPGAAVINYTYTTATSATRASVGATQQAVVGESWPLVVQTQRREMHFDSMGRLAEEKRTVGSSILRSQKTTYDSMGRRSSVTEWGSLGATRFEDYDSFDRPRRIIAPDGAATEFTYAGNRETRRTRTYESPAGPRNTTVIETRDPLGRLIRVDEQGGPTTATNHIGSNVATLYGYDVADRLVNVDMTPAGGTTQERRFAYDGRGLLISEEHPESSEASYKYDARGHMTERFVSGAPELDLRYEYDDAERLELVSTRFNGVYRPSKSFAFGTIGSGRGRLDIASRYNYLPNSSDYYLVTEDYDYDVHGRTSERDTEIKRVTGSANTIVGTFTQKWAYNDIGLPKTITYPQCNGCNSPIRNLELEYAYGLLDRIPGFIADMTYAASGTVTRVVHSNGITDRIDLQTNGLPRPQSIAFTGFCTPPVIQDEPDDQDVLRDTPITLTVGANGTSLTYKWSQRATSGAQWMIIPSATGPSLTVTASQEMFYRVVVSNACGSDTSREAHVTVHDIPVITRQPASTSIASGLTAELSVQATGTEPLSYVWYRGMTGDTHFPVGTGDRFTTPPLTTTTSYWVRVLNEYGSAESETATVTVFNPPAITTHPASRTISAGQSVPLSVAATGTGSLTYQWYRGSSGDDNTPVGTNSSNYTTPPLSATTRYWVRVTNNHGSADSNTAVLTLPLAAPSITATRVSATQIRVTWNAVPGAVQYRVQRRAGAGFVTKSVVSGALEDMDVSVVAGRGYVYRVIAEDAHGGSDSPASNEDYAVMVAFSAVGGLISNEPLDEILAGINALRLASNSNAAPLTWASLFTGSTPPPANGILPFAAHLDALRAQVNAARAALGFPPVAFAHDSIIRASHVTDLQGTLR
ncbi:MAG TPA: hypothetical protein VEK79_01165 [Thermoanaerobaculia bacterium]|nr:hypothetical protein [Thermoanaerobaculia bacterium]